jgi:hypothetical protein
VLLSKATSSSVLYSSRPTGAYHPHGPPHGPQVEVFPGTTLDDIATRAFEATAAQLPAGAASLPGCLTTPLERLWLQDNLTGRHVVLPGTATVQRARILDGA